MHEAEMVPATFDREITKSLDGRDEEGGPIAYGLLYRGWIAVPARCAYPAYTAAPAENRILANSHKIKELKPLKKLQLSIVH
jgi:hypothetical protein